MATHKFIPITYSCGLDEKSIEDTEKYCRIVPSYLEVGVGKCKDCRHLIRHGKFVPTAPSAQNPSEKESAYTLDSDTEYLCEMFKNPIEDPTKPCGFKWRGGVVSCINCPHLATRLKDKLVAAEELPEDESVYKQKFLTENPDFLEID